MEKKISNDAPPERERKSREVMTPELWEIWHELKGLWGQEWVDKFNARMRERGIIQ